MDITFAVVTYNQPDQLRRLAKSLRATWGKLPADRFLVINNHPNFRKPPGSHRVIHNSARPKESIGCLSRSWNQCLLHGWGTLARPRSEWIALVQSDVVFLSGWREKFESAVQRHDLKFLACGPGDQVVFMHHDAFRRIGWWDERFTAIGYQEFDYFARAYLQLGKQAAIEGHGAELRWNWPDLELIKRQFEGGSGHTAKANPQLLAHLAAKWGSEIVHGVLVSHHTPPNGWTEALDQKFKQSGVAIPLEYNWYPHFYKDDHGDFSELYFGYTQLMGDLDIRLHGFGPEYGPGKLKGRP